MDIQLRKERQSAAVHSCESIHKLLDEREWGGILDGEGIQVMLVLDGSEIAILFLDKEEGECVRGLGLTNISFVKVLCNELLQGDVFGQG